MDVNIEDLKQWLHKHKEEFPEKSPKKRTLMDIIGVAELENQWSYLYLFFFNEDGEHGLRDLFIRSLECVINEEEGWLKNFYVFREVDIRKKHVSDDIKNPEGLSVRKYRCRESFSKWRRPCREDYTLQLHTIPRHRCYGEERLQLHGYGSG